jgi:hypothetical protein
MTLGWGMDRMEWIWDHPDEGLWIIMDLWLIMVNLWLIMVSNGESMDSKG